MKRLTFSLALLALAATASARDLQAQRFTADLRGPLAAPTQELAGTDLNTGFGLGATVAYRLQTHLHVYGGWDWLRFRAEQSFAGTDMDFEETGYVFGLRFEHPFRSGSPMLYRLEGGGTYKHVEIENDGGDLIADSGHGLGYELGAGVLVPIGGSWRLAPMVRYRSLSQEFEVGNVRVEGDLRYTAVELGVSYRF